MKKAIVLILIVIIGLSISSCTSVPYPPDLYKQIKIGQTRQQVEEILGKTDDRGITNKGFTDVWYLDPPIIRRIDSPYAGGAIGIVYDKNGIVVKKELNTQGFYPKK